MLQANLLDRIPARKIQAGTLELNIRALGSGPLIIFLHGITSNSAVFEPLMVPLSEAFRTVAVDQRGHGLSDKPSSGYSADNYADDIAALIKELDVGPAIIVGHSLGARNGVTAAVKYPELIRSVVAIDFIPYIETEVFDALSSRVNSGDHVYQDLQAVEQYLKNRYVKLPDEAIRTRASSGYEQVDGGYKPLACPIAMAQTAEGLRSDLVTAFRDVTRPVLIVRGEESKLVSEAALAKTMRLRPDLPVVIIPGTDHYVNEEAPDLTLRAIKNFIYA